MGRRKSILPGSSSKGHQPLLQFYEATGLDLAIGQPGPIPWPVSQTWAYKVIPQGPCGTSLGFNIAWGLLRFPEIRHVLRGGHSVRRNPKTWQEVIKVWCWLPPVCPCSPSHGEDELIADTWLGQSAVADGLLPLRLCQKILQRVLPGLQDASTCFGGPACQSAHKVYQIRRQQRSISCIHNAMIVG